LARAAGEHELLTDICILKRILYFESLVFTLKLYASILPLLT